jgi:hypothetical protein
VGEKRNPLSAEWRDADGNVLYGAYYNYQFDQSGNWTSRQVWVSSLATAGGSSTKPTTG